MLRKQNYRYRKLRATDKFIDILKLFRRYLFAREVTNGAFPWPKQY